MNNRTIARADARAQCLADVSALLRAFGFDADELHLARAPLADVLRSAASAPDDDARPTMRPPMRDTVSRIAIPGKSAVLS